MTRIIYDFAVKIFYNICVNVQSNSSISVSIFSVSSKQFEIINFIALSASLSKNQVFVIAMITKG